MRLTSLQSPAGYLALTLLWLAAASGVANATSAIVPDDYATVQGAIDSGVDTVVVKEGTYAENLVVANALTLLADDSPVGFGPWYGAAVVGGLSATAEISARGIRFTGPVTLTHGPSSNIAHFEGCRFDAPFETPSHFWTFLSVRGCMFMADVNVVPYSASFVHNTFVAAHLDVRYEGGVRYVGNTFVGPGEFGLRTTASEGGVTIAGNTVTGKVDGIIVTVASSALVRDNDVYGCSGTAFRSEWPDEFGVGSTEFINNRVRDCGGHGFDLDRISGWLEGNVVSGVGGDGIRANGVSFYRVIGNDIRHAGGRGITNDGGAITGLIRNTVLDVAGDGIVLEFASRADSNVVGRAGGKGIWIRDGFKDHIRWNTVFMCAGDGIDVTSSGADTISNNIAYANGGKPHPRPAGWSPTRGGPGVGFAWAGSGTAFLACNDWFDNKGGATSGIEPGATDLEVDPLFCDVDQGDVRLSAGSPLLDAPGCGGIGALGQGCAASLSLMPARSAGAHGLLAFPDPALDRVTFAWPSSDGAAKLEVFDVTGARRWTASAPASTSQVTWDLVGPDGAKLPAGVYWARVTGDRGVAWSRVVVIR